MGEKFLMLEYSKKLASEARLDMKEKENLFLLKKKRGEKSYPIGFAFSFPVFFLDKINYLSYQNLSFAMKSPLIKKTNFRDMHDEIVLKAQALKQKNDQYQRLSAETMDSYMMQEIVEEKKMIEQEIA